MTEQALDNLLRKVMLDAARQEYGDLIEQQPEHGFSPEFEKKMQKLLRRAKHPAWHKFVQIAACLLLVLLLAGCAVLAVSPEAREVFAGWVREAYETYFVYHYNEEMAGSAESVEAVQLETVYRPTWIPEGYREVSANYSERGQSVLRYETEQKELLTVVYAHDLDAGALFLERGEAKQTSVSVHGTHAELYIDPEKDGANALVWQEENSGFLFWISGPITEEELVRVAESVTAVPGEPRPTWVPEGYERFDEVSGARGFIFYHNQENEQIHFLKYPYSAGAVPDIWISMTEGDVKKQILVAGQLADLYWAPEGGISVLIWADEYAKSAFLLNGPLTEEEIIQMAESLQTAPVQQAPHRPSWLPEGYSFAGQSNGGGSLDLEYNAESKEPILFPGIGWTAGAVRWRWKCGKPWRV